MICLTKSEKHFAYSMIYGDKKHNIEELNICPSISLCLRSCRKIDGCICTHFVGELLPVIDMCSITNMFSSGLSYLLPGSVLSLPLLDCPPTKVGQFNRARVVDCTG